MARIILSYRRSDSATMTQLIFSRLAARYGEHSIFMDIDNIPFGVDFRAHIRDNVRASDLLLAIVGAGWTGVNANGEPRILEPDDPVRAEVEIALEHSVTVIPVLVEHASMPSVAQLPESLKDFPYLNAMHVESGRDLALHMERLTRVIDDILRAKGKLPKPRAPSAPLDRLLALLASPFPWALAGATVLPFIGALIGLSPPWPRGAAAITAVVTCVATILIFHSLREASLRAVNRITAVSALALALTASIYLVAVSLFTYQTPTTNEYWAKGFVCTAEALVIYKDKCPNLGIDELQGAEYEAERLWTSQSVTIIRVTLVVLWLLAFVAIAAVIGSLLVHPARAETRQVSPA
jgi:hypothetical protein